MSRRRDARFTFLLSLPERRRLDRAAAANGIRASDYARMRIFLANPPAPPPCDDAANDGQPDAGQTLRKAARTR